MRRLCGGGGGAQAGSRGSLTSGGTTETKMVPSAIWRVASALATTPQRHERKLSCGAVCGAVGCRG